MPHTDKAERIAIVRQLDGVAIISTITRLINTILAVLSAMVGRHSVYVLVAVCKLRPIRC